MPIIIAEDNFILSQSEIDAIWQAVQRECRTPDDIISFKSVDEAEIKRLNNKYRQTNKATNVLTFSYGEGEHDVAICLTVAEREARDRKMDLKPYAALLVTHALLHAAGVDHEASVEEAERMAGLEEKIVREQGWGATHL